jgi:hypothetical protein
MAKSHIREFLSIFQGLVVRLRMVAMGPALLAARLRRREYGKDGWSPDDESRRIL